MSDKRFDIMGQHYVVYGWMRQGLGLKGSMLELYALVYGYNVSGREFTASLDYMCEWTGLSKKQVIDNMKRLCDKGYLNRYDIRDRGIKMCRYEVDEGWLQKVNVVVTKGKWGVYETTPNNIENNNNNIILSIEEREWKFREDLRGYEGRYGRDMIEAFYGYWSEPTQDRMKMKWELQETWDVGRRLEGWSKRESKNQFNNNFRGGGNTLNSALNYGTNNQKCFAYRETENERRIREEREAIVAELGGAYEW